jgi:uncharacterized repeat protein (TIGR01451 family)
MARYFRPFILVLTLLLSTLGVKSTSWSVGDTYSLPAPTDAVQRPPTSPVVVRLYVQDKAHLDAVAGRLDIWESHPDEKYVVAAVQPAQYQWLQGLGYSMEIDAVKTARLQAPMAALDPRFYYYDDNFTNPNGLYIVDFLQDTDATFSDIVQLNDIGDAWQGLHGEYHRDIWVLRITNEDPAYGPIPDKPAFFLFANIHAREVAVPELAIRYIKYLTSGYNGQGGYDVDPDVTWLVNHNVVYVLVMQNPDGHRVNEQDTWAYRRKNMDSDDGCTDPNSWGVDMNRNHSFLWNCCGGSSGYACDETYRGPSAGSEPETGAFQSYFASVMQDQNGPNGDNTIAPASPLTTTGIFISLHSYSDLTLYPWGFSDYGPAPNDAQLAAIGHKFAYYTGYDEFTIGYDVDGATDDWTYGKFGLASYTFEVGPSSGSCGGFFPAYECIDGAAGYPRNFWAENRPAFIYAHKIARTPYMTAYGPDAESLLVTPEPVDQGAPVTLTAVIADHRCCSDPLQPVAAAEYFVDAPGQDGSGAPMNPSDGAWGETNEGVTAQVDTAGLPLGRHYILVHGQNDDGDWGPFTAVFVTVTAAPDSAITGVVRDNATAAPLDQADVHLWGGPYNQSTTTGPDGAFTFAVYSDTYELEAVAYGYYTAAIPGVQALTGLTTTQDISLTAIPQGVIAGQITEGITGAPLSATVVAESDYTTLYASSDPATGLYALPAFSGAYTVTASAPAHLPASASATVQPGLTTTVNLALEPPGTLAGRVLQAGTALPLLATLTLSPPGLTPQVTTDPATGLYSLAAFGGDYTVTASAAGHTPVSASVTLSAGLTTTQDFVLESQACLLLVDDDGGQAHETAFHAALADAGYYYQTWDTAALGPPPLAALQPYQTVLWFTADHHDAGFPFYILDSSVTADLTAYLDGGGHLLLTGHNVNAGNYDTSLFSNRLATTYNGSLPNTVDYPVSGGGLLSGIDGLLTGSVYSSTEGFTPDYITPAAGAAGVFTYTTGPWGAGVAHDAGGYRTLNLGFGLEALDDPEQQAETLARGLDWLGCPASPVGLRLSKQAAQETVPAGAPLTYTLTLTNTSLVAATGLLVTDTLPTGLSFLAASHGGAAGNGVVAWNLAPLASFERLTLTLTARVGDLADGALIVNALYSAAAAQSASLWTGGPVTTTVEGVVAPQAGFTHNAPIPAGQTVVFTNTTLAARILTYTWSFGDDSEPIYQFTHLPTTTHAYAQPGWYSVTLTAANPAGSDVFADQVEIIAAQAEHNVYLPVVLK